MSKIEIAGVFSVTPENQDLFLDLWDGGAEGQQGDVPAGIAADEQKIIFELLSRHRASEMLRVDRPQHPYYPDEDREPDTEMWMYQNPTKQGDSDRMVGLYVDVLPDGNGGFKETPKHWLVGQKASVIVVYKKSCCPQYSVMLFAKFDDGFDFMIRDDIRNHHEDEKQLFAKSVSYDEAGGELKHAHLHVTGQSHDCHGHAHVSGVAHRHRHV